MLQLPDSAIRDWAIKEVVSREVIPSDANDLQYAAAVRRQTEALQTYAAAALRRYAVSIDYAEPITATDRTAAALAIAARAAELRRQLAAGESLWTNVSLPIPSALQLRADEAICGSLSSKP